MTTCSQSLAIFFAKKFSYVGITKATIKAKKHHVFSRTEGQVNELLTARAFENKFYYIPLSFCLQGSRKLPLETILSVFKPFSQIIQKGKQYSQVVCLFVCLFVCMVIEERSFFTSGRTKGLAGPISLTLIDQPLTPRTRCLAHSNINILLSPPKTSLVWVYYMIVLHANDHVC